MESDTIQRGYSLKFMIYKQYEVISTVWVVYFYYSLFIELIISVFISIHVQQAFFSIFFNHFFIIIIKKKSLFTLELSSCMIKLKTTDLRICLYDGVKF